MSMWVEIVFKVAIFFIIRPKNVHKDTVKKLGQKVPNLATHFENLSN